jgi:hypothetical protein
MKAKGLAERVGFYIPSFLQISDSQEHSLKYALIQEIL